MPKDNQDSSDGGVCGETPLASAKFAYKAVTTLSKSNKSCPCATWMVRHVSRIYEDDDVDGGGSTAAVVSTKALAIASPKGGALNVSLVEDSTRGHLELAFNWAAICLRNVESVRF